MVYHLLCKTTVNGWRLFQYRVTGLHGHHGQFVMLAIVVIFRVDHVKCNDPLPSEYDLYCNGSSMETKMCNTTSTLGSVEKTDNEKRYSAGVVAGVAIGCIIITIVVMLLGLYAVLRLRIYKQSANQSSKPEESYDDLKINQTTGAYSVYTNQNNTQTVISKTNNRQSNVPGDTYDNLGQDFYENISQK
ncbi:unnamed protein product [Mytilus edulis]|uniref:Uncharacterized protein n=1 Tax=Mytilus edulis TaxID=6550 RepID=A0A8S3UL25_MYTED|nr:unnamed protein product [Mytilus edulis]